MRSTRRTKAPSATAQHLQKNLYVPTYTHPQLLDGNYDDRYTGNADNIARQRFLIENHERAIALLENVEPYQHNQGVWAQKSERNVCGTAACAFGWVAITNLLPGLQYAVDDDDEYHPVINGKVDISWGHAADQFFGDKTATIIFSNTTLSMPVVLKRMRTRLRQLKTGLARMEAEKKAAQRRGEYS